MAAAVSVRTWVVVVALASVLMMMPRRPVGAAAAETVAAATAAPAEQPAMKPKCQPGATTGPCRVGAVHDPENQEEEGMLNMRARSPAGAPDTDSDDDYSDADLPQDDDLVVLGH
ncbi:hypothetical protein GUJ93_ZPchr0012g20358 [Zizania palustris]|uniref:Uncharacterized protein n=1 Tax=Zizania palustris TaxID=103762 RepID=A0A8J6BZ38_ZIZPA|nr:hypothetical protein GUJ93_ZPchr0012g21283 [Zizania palustris]KAG8094905.1 hypothetical protein GUJ93_ZPchr0012g20358 [Zizania palustris]